MNAGAAGAAGAAAAHSRMDRKPPWACPRCLAPAGQPCRSNSIGIMLPQMHIARWNAKPREPWSYPA